jgi:hypothetical protein
MRRSALALFLTLPVYGSVPLLRALSHRLRRDCAKVNARPGKSNVLTAVS